jgi:peptidyl-tRNA hydrolase
VRADLSRSQQAVQAGHAVAEWCFRETDRAWDEYSRFGGSFSMRWENHTLVYLKVRDLKELEDWYKNCREAVAFYEPDIGGQMTAFCTLTPHPEFGSLRLL